MDVDGERRIWTVGTGHRTLAELVTILASAGVDRVADVRSYPKSHLAHFDRERLGEGLGEAGVDYVWLGADLGGLRPGGYAAYMESERFGRGLAELEGRARERPTAILCAEVDPGRCHRALVAGALAERGWEVVHLLGEGRAEGPGPRQRELPFGR